MALAFYIIFSKVVLGLHSFLLLACFRLGFVLLWVFKKQLIYFHWRITVLQYCDSVCHTSTESAIGIHEPPPWENPPHLSGHPNPPGHHRAQALGALHHPSNSHWRSVLHMVICMFQSCSLKPPHPLLLPLSPKICSLCLCLLCCPVHTIIGSIFLYSIFMC